MPIPSEINVPQIPIACPRLFSGMMSVTNAVAPVGVNPAARPWKKRSNRNKGTVKNNG